MKTIFNSTFVNRYLTTLIFLVFLFSNSQAATITWIAGNDTWNDPTNWDLGYVPTGDDVVIINSGLVGTTQGTFSYANRIVVGNGATLHLKAGSTLTLEDASGAPAIENEGLLEIYGTLNITAAYIGGNGTNGGRGILNKGTTIVGNTGILDLYEIEHTGIENISPGVFKNYGIIEIFEVLDKGITNYYQFDNIGSIEVYITGTSSGSGILNRNLFRNYSNGNISLTGGRHGVSNIVAGRFYNWGDMEIENSGLKGISNNNRFYNKSNGSIEINNTGNSGLSNSDRFYNQGSLTIENSGWSAIFNQGDFYNSNYLQTGTAQVNTIWNYGSGSYFSNSGTMHLDNPTSSSIQTNGTFENQNTGKIFATNRIFAYTGIFSNFGIITNTFSAGNSFSSNPDFLNEGIIEDVYGLSGIAYNDEVILAPISGTLQAGVPFPNALDISDYDNVEYGLIYYDEEKSKVVGEYDYKLNEIHPNSSAVGLTELYFDLRIKGTDNSKMCIVKLNNPILPFVTFGNTQIQEAAPRNLNQDITVFPNPTPGNLNWSGENLNEAASSIQVFNTMGQLVAEYNFGKFETIDFNLSQHLNNGVYTLQCIQNGKRVGLEKITLMRE